MTKFRQFSTLALCLVLLCGLVLPLVPSDVSAVGTSVSVSYSTNDGTTLSQTVNVLTANGTADMALAGGYSLNSSGVTFDGSGYGTSSLNAQRSSIQGATYSIWFVPTSVSGVYTILNNGDASGSGIMIVLADGFLYFYTHGGDVSNYMAIGVSVGNLYHVVVAYDAADGKARYYENGTLMGTSGALASWSSSSQTVTMAEWSTGAFKFSGMICSAEIVWGYWSQTNVTTAFNAGTRGVWDNNLAGWWTCDELSGSHLIGYNFEQAMNPSFVGTFSTYPGGVNTSVTILPPTTIQNATDEYAPTVTTQRYNGTTLDFPFVHYVALSFAVSPVGSGSVNQTAGWYTTLTYLNINTISYMGYSFANYTKNGGYAGNNATATLYVLAHAAIVANFQIAGTPTEPTQPTGQNVAWVAILFYLFFFSMSVICVAIAPFRRFLLVLMFAFLDIIFGLAQLTVSGTTLPASPWSEMMMIVLGGVMLFVAANAKPTIAGKHP